MKNLIVEWLNERSLHINQLPDASESELKPNEGNQLSQFQQAFGYTVEELTKQIGPMAVEGKEQIGSMGNDSPLAVLSNYSQLLYNYFKQQFAQVTNPPIDAIREQFVTSTSTLLGAEGNLLDPNSQSCQRIRLETPVISDAEMAKLRHYQQTPFISKTIFHII